MTRQGGLPTAECRSCQYYKIFNKWEHAGLIASGATFSAYNAEYSKINTASDNQHRKN